MYEITLLHIKDDMDMVTVIFVIMILTYTLMTFIFMRNYWNKSYLWRHREHSHTTKFQDYDISIHSIMVTNIDRSIPLKEATATVESIFKQLFPGDKVISTKMVARMDKLYLKAKQLRELKKQYRYYRNLNRENEEMAANGECKLERKTFKKRKNCLMGTLKYDTEDYYKFSIEELCEKLNQEKETVEKGNSGYAFVSF